MNNKGFTLVELLATLLIIGIIFTISFNMFKGTFSKIEIGIDNINDSEIYRASESYILETNKIFNHQGYVCIKLSDLIDYGYLNIDTYEDKTIKVTRNNDTKVIEKVEYTDNCE